MLDALKAVVGAGYVDTSLRGLEDAATATFATSQRPVARVFPADAAQLAACLEICAKLDVAVHPVSRGRNWGYGSRVAPVDKAVLLDLHRLDRIHGFDADTRAITLGPGVSFRQLAQFVQPRAADVFLTAPGSGDGASVLAHALQGGVAQAPRPSRHARLRDLQFVDRFGTKGHAAQATALPDGAIVTQASLALDRRPPFTQYFQCITRPGASLSAALGQTKALMQRDVVVTNVFCHTAAKLAQLGVRHATGWRIEMSVAAENEAYLQLKAAKLRAALSAVCSIQASQINAPNAFFGTAQADGLMQAYHAKPRAERGGRNPDLDGCGVIWCACQLPVQAVDSFETTATTILQTHGFAPSLTLYQEGPDQVIGLAGLIYDRAQIGADATAQRCASDLLAAYTKKRWSLHRTPAHFFTQADEDKAGIRLHETPSPV